ncbi:SWI/SNF chromatin-remodeling complex subunit SNF5 isoform X2 [Drosophila novamexicana]|uniref:SWI/SNF chromatin-remodeling complex subunit SNF5 isoform X2 n=1 Tax=Drosophila novamexicana TaxID=47314 RepID=UPI0011E5B9C2|nr:SWI/SNF chromatin-remodeling complex subunit SNF5 isoform X2 [Drosophila novamexicana]
MVRRRGIVGGLAKQLSYSAYQHMMAPPPPGQHLNIGWLGSPSVHWPPQAPRPPSLMSVMCNKMVGSLPRMPSLPQPELSSRRLSRLRRNLMQSPHPQVLPAYPPAPLVQTANILPMWCRSDEQMWCDPVKQRHRLPTSDISIQLKQQLQQLKRQQQLQQQRQRQQQQQQQQQQQRQLRSGFMPFNFGKCASSLIKFLDRSGSTSESSLYAATHPNPVPEVQPVPTISIVKRPYSVERHIHAADFDYVKLAKQMVTSKDKQFTGCGVGRTQVLPTHGEPHRLANRGSSKAPVARKSSRPKVKVSKVKPQRRCS